MISELFPLGTTHYLMGGILVGLGIAIVYIMQGIYSGSSSFFPAVLSYFSRNRLLKTEKIIQSRKQKIIFALGTILGAALLTLFRGNTFVTSIPWWQLFIGGILVGFGTRYAKGCTSGHGICGTSSFTIASIVAVVIFLAMAIITANIVGVVVQ